MNKNDKFRCFENADDDFIEKLSDTPKISNSEKERMFKMSMERFNTMDKGNSDVKETAYGDSVEGVEKYKGSKWYVSYITTAACVVLIAGIAVTAFLMKNNNDKNPAVNDPVVLSTQTTENSAITETTISTTSATTTAADVTIGTSVSTTSAASETTTQSATETTTAPDTSVISETTTDSVTETTTVPETTISAEERELVGKAQDFFETACETYWMYRYTPPFDIADDKYDENGNVIGKEYNWKVKENGEDLGHLIKNPEIKSIDDVLEEYYKTFSDRYPNDIRDAYIEYNGNLYVLSGNRGYNISYKDSRVSEFLRIEGDEIFFTAEYSYYNETFDENDIIVKKEIFSVIVQPDGSWKVGQFSLPY
ncbi:MAG: hypothetical protein IKJ60_06830 [Ruminococcus sp.]|nr:hypothetical protein [Ruminococcus sp.]